MIRTPDRRVLSFGRRKTFEEGRIQVGKTSHSEAEKFDKGNSKVNEFKGLYLFWLQNGIVGGHMTLIDSGAFIGTSKITRLNVLKVTNWK